VSEQRTKNEKLFSIIFTLPPVDDPPPVVFFLRMNNNLTEIAFILDRSGSMASCAEAAIAGFNQFIRDQRQQPGQARLTLVLFDDQYETPTQAVPLPEVVELDTTTFVPRGSTALLDAIGRTIDELGARLAGIPEADRPGCVIVPILTDGFENASHTFTYEEIQQKITHQRDVYQWQFLFLGANQDAIASGARIGIQPQMSASFVADAFGTGASMKGISRRTSAQRAAASLGPDAPMYMKEDLTKPLQELVKEEDDANRGKKPTDKPGTKPGE